MIRKHQYSRLGATYPICCNCIIVNAAELLGFSDNNKVLNIVCSSGVLFTPSTFGKSNLSLCSR